MVLQGPPADLVASFTEPLPYISICDFLGIPADDRDQFGHWASTVLSTAEEQALEALANLYGYMADLIRLRRNKPSDTLLDQLIHAEQLSEHEILGLAMSILVGGLDNTSSKLASSIVFLLGDQEQLKLLKANPTRIICAVEELLRMSPGKGGAMIRIAMEDVFIGDTEIRAGEAVVPVPNAANRDPSVFDKPDKLDLARSPNPHITFGHGVHRCPAAEFARMVIQVALERLLELVPRIKLDLPDVDLEWKCGLIVHGLASLPASW
jgi:cytochrome P450